MVTCSATTIDIYPHFSYKTRISLIEGAFPEGRPEKRSKGDARGRICSPHPGGLGVA
jgi:hypothetical protein